MLRFPVMKAKTVRDIAAIVRNRRDQLRWTQAQLAAKAGVGREWIIEFEKGKPTVEWGLVIRVLRELGMTMDLRIEPTEPAKAADELDQILNSTRKKVDGSE
jgi:y4mF family transcriptional regulator